MKVYYNDIDKQKAAWLRELITHGHIAPGDVDERSITAIRADDLRGYRQCHFFAGIGIWSYALRLAGWPDDREVWTGSCPCQSFSTAGKGEGFNDPRHLWPAWARLIKECRPPVIFGEQVDSAIRHGWLDLVSSDLEDAGYSVGAAVLGACSVGAPHRRQRLYFVAHFNDEEEAYRAHDRRAQAHSKLGICGEVRGVGDAAGERFQGNGAIAGSKGNGRCGQCGVSGAAGGVEQFEAVRSQARIGRHMQPGAGSGALAGFEQAGSVVRPSPLNGFWRDADWLFCRDGKWRPVETGTFPLAHGVAGRVGLLRGYGDGIVAQVAAEFIKAYMEIRNSEHK